MLHYIYMYIYIYICRCKITIRIGILIEILLFHAKGSIYMYVLSDLCKISRLLCIVSMWLDSISPEQKAVCPFVSLSIDLPMCQSVYWSAHLSVYLLVCPFVRLFIGLPICQSVYWSAYMPSVYWSVCRSVYWFVRLFIGLPICPSIYWFVHIGLSTPIAFQPYI